MQRSIVRLVVICALATAGCLGGPTHTVTGLIDLLDSTGAAIAVTGTTCRGIGPYRDMGSGTPVTIDDGSGGVTGSLSPGEVRSSTDCQFTFSVAGVPDAPMYSLEVDQLGGTPEEPQSELEADNWVMALTIGSTGPIPVPVGGPMDRR